MTGRASRDRDERLPERMRDYRIEAEPRQSPDLHKLVQLFIGMAFAEALGIFSFLVALLLMFAV